MNTQVVNEDVRRRNSNAVNKRNEWRSRYALLESTIKLIKFRLQTTSYNHRENQIILNALRKEANSLMEKRQEIGCELKTTSYPYAERVKREYV